MGRFVVRKTRLQPRALGTRFDDGFRLTGPAVLTSEGP